MNIVKKIEFKILPQDFSPHMLPEIMRLTKEIKDNTAFVYERLNKPFFMETDRLITASIRDEYSFRLKEDVYKFLSKTLTTAIYESCSISSEEKDCNEGCVIHRLTEEFTSLRSIIDYIAVINPSNTCCK